MLNIGLARLVKAGNPQSGQVPAPQIVGVSHLELVESRNPGSHRLKPLACSASTALSPASKNPCNWAGVRLRWADGSSERWCAGGHLSRRPPVPGRWRTWLRRRGISHDPVPSGMRGTPGSPRRRPGCDDRPGTHRSDAPTTDTLWHGPGAGSPRHSWTCGNPARWRLHGPHHTRESLLKREFPPPACRCAPVPALCPPL